MWRIAVKTLIADRGKLVVALVGIVFSVVLVNIQGGLFIGLIRKASLLVDNGEAQIWVGHKEMRNVDFPKEIPRGWLTRIQPVDGVTEVQPYAIGYTRMTLPNGGYEMIVMVGSDAKSGLGGGWNLLNGNTSVLDRPDGVIVDVYDRGKLDDPFLNEVREIDGRRAEIVGFSEGILGFIVTPYVFTTFNRANEFLSRPSNSCSYFLVKCAPGVDLQRVCDDIMERVPDVHALTQSQYARKTIDYWLTRTGLGISFGASTLLGLVVGMIMVGQTLYSSVLDRLNEYGTLMALGAVEKQIYWILLLQGVAMAIIGSLLGVCVVVLAQSYFSSPRATIVIPWWLSVGACVCVTLICLICSLLPFFRIRQIDPASVLQA